MNREFGAVLTGLMENRGLTRKDLAHSTGRAVTTILRLQAGRQAPTVEPLTDIAPTLRIPMADMLAIAGIVGDAPESPTPAWPLRSGLYELVHEAAALTDA